MPAASGVNRPQWAITLSDMVIRRLCGPCAADLADRQAGRRFGVCGTKPS